MSDRKTLDELLEQARAEGHRVIEVDATRAYEGGLSPFIVIRAGDRAALVNPLAFDDHLCVDVNAYDHGQEVTAGAFGMTEGNRVAFPLTGDTSHGWNSTAMVAVLIGDQGTAAEEEPEPDLRAHVRELHPRMTLRGRTDAEVAREHGRQHHQFGSTTHHHGPNAGAHARPAGWRTGGGVVRVNDRIVR
jgi:hypothetical protein